MRFFQKLAVEVECFHQLGEVEGEDLGGGLEGGPGQALTLATILYNERRFGERKEGEVEGGKGWCPSGHLPCGKWFIHLKALSEAGYGGGELGEALAHLIESTDLVLCERHFNRAAVRS